MKGLGLHSDEKMRKSNGSGRMGTEPEAVWKTCMETYSLKRELESYKRATHLPDNNPHGWIMLFTEATSY